jgi:hypothetical protein
MKISIKGFEEYGLQLTNSFEEDDRASMMDKPASPVAPTIVTFMMDDRGLIVVNE